MSDLAAKWDQRYSAREDRPEACWVLENNQHLLPKESIECLDLAAGRGGNALLLASKGYRVSAWDLSTVGLEQCSHWAQTEGLSVDCMARDVETHPPEPESFDLIVISHFLDRALCPAIRSALRPGGLLFYQTFRREKLSNSGPNSPTFTLENNELIKLFPDLQLLYYREDADSGDLNLGLRDQAYLVARVPTA